jgi:ribosomal protein S8E
MEPEMVCSDETTVVYGEIKGGNGAKVTDEELQLAFSDLSVGEITCDDEDETDISNEQKQAGPKKRERRNKSRNNFYSDDSDHVVKRKPRKNTGRGYVRGGNTTKRYRVAKTLLTFYTKLKTKNFKDSEVKNHLISEIMKNSMSMELLSHAALSLSKVYEDVKTMDESTADEIAKKIDLIMCDENNANHEVIKSVAAMNVNQLQLAKDDLLTDLENIKFHIRVVEYYLHLCNDPKILAVELKKLLLSIVSDAF